MSKNRSLTAILLAVSIACALLLLAGAAPAPTSDVLVVQVDRPGAGISPTMFGVFFEDINFAADGGLYPERVKNQSFEFTEPLNAWSKLERGGSEGELLIRTEDALNENNQHYLRLRVHEPASGYGIVNSGFRGMGLESGQEYILSAYVRAHKSGPQQLDAEVRDPSGTTIGTATLKGFSTEWKKYEAILRPTTTSAKAQLSVFVKEKGDIDLDMVSRYPKTHGRAAETGSARTSYSSWQT